MSDRISAKEAARQWGLAIRTVTGLCRSGKLPGAEKKGRDWTIPADAVRPADNRVRSGNYISEKHAGARLPLPVGISDYRLASTRYYYIDKTMLIRDLLDERPAVTLFTRPRRFGKTLNMDMLRTFFEKTDEDTSLYFEDKQIWEQGEYYRSFQGKYPVIFLSFKDVKKRNWEETYAALSMLIAQEFIRHKELKDTAENRKYYESAVEGSLSRPALEESLKMLTMMLSERYGERAVVIIDEYDTPIESGYVNGFYDEVISFMRNFLSGGLKDNKCLSFGFLTGILRVAKESIFSGLNNLKINSVLDNRFSMYFGFTAEEVRRMAMYYGAADRLGEVCEWYDGYRFGKTDIFNPWSVINYFSNECEARAYWLSTGSNDLIGEMLRQADDEIYCNLTKLMNGESFTTYVDTGVIYPEIGKRPSSVYSFLLVAGYLKVVRSSVSLSGDFMCEVALPDKELSLVYRKEILQRFENMIPQSLAIGVEEALFTGDAEKLQDRIGKLLLRSVSSFDAAGESFYHGLMLGLCAVFGDYYLTSNRESGEGRYDICLEPRKRSLPGVIIELKAGKDRNADGLQKLAETALRQTEEKKYSTDMKAKGVEPVFRFGVAFSGKNVAVRSGN